MSDLELYGRFGGLLERLWHALRILVEGLDSLLESLGTFGRSGKLRGRSFGDLGLLLGGFCSLLESLAALLRPLAPVLGAAWFALGTILEDVWRSF